MSIRSSNGAFEVALGPPRRGAPDSLRTIIESRLRENADFHIASQQIADPGVVNAIADIRSGRDRRARIFVEQRYLVEAAPVVHPDRIWEPGGRWENNRRCRAALNRAGIEVRTDIVGGALQHINMIIAKSPSESSLFLTSANLSTGSIDRHLNWALDLRGRVVETAMTVFDTIWDGDFRDASLQHALTSDGKEWGHLVVGAHGEAVDEALKIIEGASERIRFAYFTMSTDTRVVQALLRASQLGIDVAGIVDADQGTQHWNGVPQLRSGGVDARYYPGALTGASGRMHHKTIVVDRRVTHFSTANASHAAESSLELGTTIIDEAAAVAVDKELLRLGANARTSPIIPF